MSKYKGHLRDLGELPRDVLLGLVTKAELSEHLWTSNDPRFSTSHPDSQHIVFKFPEAYSQSHLRASRTPLWGEWEGLLSPIIDMVKKKYWYESAETSKVMLSRLKSKGKIPTHVDSNSSSAVPNKVHVPLITSSEVIFVIGGTRHNLEFGRAYEINNLLAHSVENNSYLDRVHLIFEIYSTDIETSVDQDEAAMVQPERADR